MEFDVRWDREREVARIEHTSLLLDSKVVVHAWREALFAKLEAIRGVRGKRFPIVVCIDHFMIRPKVADAYGRVVREMIERFASEVAHYGEPSTVTQIIAVEAMKEGFRANLFESFEQAMRSCTAEPGSAPPTSRSLRSPVLPLGDAPRSVRSPPSPVGAAPSPRSVRSPLATTREAMPSSRSLPPRHVLKSVVTKPAAQAASEEPSAPTSRRSERITSR